jgi:SHS2 domain-containing protein
VGRRWYNQVTGETVEEKPVIEGRRGRMGRDHGVIGRSEEEIFAVMDGRPVPDREPPYCLFDHGADIGILFSGGNSEDLLRNGARALMSIIVERVGAGGQVAQRVVLEAGDDLPVRFLNELLYLFDVERFMAEDLSLTIKGDEAIIIIRGTVFEEGRDRIRREVKAATYHGFTVERKTGRLEARVILDL